MIRSARSSVSIDSNPLINIGIGRAISAWRASSGAALLKLLSIFWYILPSTSLKVFSFNKILTNNIAVDLEKGIAKETGRLTTAQSLARKMGKNFVAEGVAEEMGQAVVSGTQKDYYNRKYDDNATNRVNSYLDSFIRNMGETYGTAKGWEEGFIGGFSGMVGIPGMPGNLISQIKETQKENI